MTIALCRFCGSELRHSFCDLGLSPLSNAFVSADALGKPEAFFPLHARVCGTCFLVQLPEVQTPDQIFTDYAYFSSYSEYWLEHARRFADSAIDRFHLNGSSKVVEVASNDGYLLQYFVARSIPVLGIEPAANVAREAVRKGIPTLVKFFGVTTANELSRSHGSADLLIGNNVLAHVPQINDFVAGLKILLAEEGALSLEFPHLQRLIEGNQFDTIYHEHFSYFSLLTVRRIFARHGLEVFDAEELPTHGGSLRIYAQHAHRRVYGQTSAVEELVERERNCGLEKIERYAAFAEQVRETKRQLLTFLIEAKRAGKQIVGYGAPAKGNTLLNYCGIREDFLEYTVDRSPHKQGRYLPGSRIPIFAPERLAETRPDYVLILPWNLRDEIIKQLAYVREWGARLVVPIPRVEMIQ